MDCMNCHLSALENICRSFNMMRVSKLSHITVCQVDCSGKSTGPEPRTDTPQYKTTFINSSTLDTWSFDLLKEIHYKLKRHWLLHQTEIKEVLWRRGVA